ncbi:MAG TPA: glycosyltransferase family 87 protein [Abditibacterium sp.]
MSSDAPRRVFSPQFLGLLAKAVVALAIFHAAFLFLVWFPDNWMRADRFRDFTVYFDAALRLKNGAPLYQIWPDYTPADFPSRFFYPPPFLLLTRPLVEFDYIWFGRIWTTFLLVAFWIYALCLAKLSTGKTGLRAVLVAGLAINLCPRGYAALGYGNFEPVMWACYGIALSTSFRAAPLAFAAMIKLHPVWVLALVIRNEGKRAFWTAFAVIVGGFTFGIWLCGWQNALNWWPATSPVVSQGTFVPDNVSISFALIRFFEFVGWIQRDLPLPIWAKAYLSMMALGAPLTALILTRHQPQNLRYALIACATILFAPLCWSIYLPLLLAPAAIWARQISLAKSGA